MSQENKTIAQPQYSSLRLTLMISAVIWVGIVVGFGNFKFMPMQDAIMDYFRIAEGAYGYLNTASGWISLICAIPMGFLVRKLPCNVSVSLGFGVALCGIAIQCTVHNFVFFVIGRMIEGAGSGLIGLVTASLILNLVPKHRISIFSSIMIFAGILPQVVMTKGGTALMQNSGLAFQHLAPGAMTARQLEYLQNHLRILSGFYGVLKPFDGIVPYRLEMQAVLPDTGSLYDYWKDDIYREVRDEDGIILNLASKEYSRCVQEYLGEDDTMITAVFAQIKNGRPVQKATMAKMARGEMTWWLSENQVEDVHEIVNFNAGYEYSRMLSDETEYVFVKKGK
jgi:cytoplasmic iron level regulating protein YaaA (DUF328/UPF0246 family)